jgi:hypothetical protein
MTFDGFSPQVFEWFAGLERQNTRGYPCDHPRVELLRHTSVIAGRRIAGAAGISRDAALDHATTVWRAAAPLNAWLDAHVGQS